MLIKAAEDRQRDLETLTALAARPDVDADTRQRIETEMRKIKAGLKGEQEAAYEIEFHWGDSKNYVSIHDLRIEHEGRVAQIDHLLINRMLEMWVLESKHFGEGLGINEHGEFTGFYRGRPYGVPSPIEQNRRHIEVLGSVLKSGRVEVPRRLGLAMLPNISSLVLVSKHARISRPKSKILGLETIIKNDQLFTTVVKQLDESSMAKSVMQVSRVIGTDTLEAFGRSLAALHTPVKFDWKGRFGLPEEAPRMTGRPPPLPKSRRPRQEAPTASVESAQREEATAAAETGKGKKRICVKCQTPVSYSVARFCWFNKPRFGGEIYCMDCQKSVAPT